MIRLRTICGVWLAGVLSACTHLPPGGQPAALIDSDILQSAKEYSAQRRELEDSRPWHAEIDKVNKSLKQLQNDLWRIERQVIGTAVRYEQAGKWYEADKVFALGLNALPESSILRAAREQLRERRDIKQETLRAELQINEAEQLLKDARPYEQIVNLNSTNLFTRLEHRAYERQRERAAKRLLKFGEWANDQQDFALAKRCLLLAEQLDNSLNIIEPLRVAEQKTNINSVTTVASIAHVSRSSDTGGNNRSVKRTQASRSFSTELEEYKTLRAEEDFVKAKLALSTMREKYPDNRKLKSLENELDAAIHARVISAAETGKALYSKGDVQQALNVWQEVLPLAPEDAELQHNISRAKKLLENVRTLRQKQSG